MIKIAYKKKTEAVVFTVIETDPVEKDTCLRDPLTGEIGWQALPNDKHGSVWETRSDKLDRVARSLAAYNGRKNVCSTTDDFGVLY